MLRIITGRSGSGKSGRCIAEFNSYIQKHKDIDSWAYFFVPEQYTMLTERRLLEYQRREGYASLGLVGHEVLNFKRFSHRILGMYGGASEKPLTESGKIMMLTAACAKLSRKLEYFTSLSERPAEIARVLSLIEEFGKYGVNKERLDSAETGDSYLDRKLSDIKMIINEYSEMKAGRFTDENDIFEIMLSKIEEKPFFEGRRIWIDSFTGFTSRELDLITLMMRQAESVTVTLCTDLSGDPAFTCTDSTYLVLKELAKQNSVECTVINLSENDSGNMYKYTDDSLRILEKYVTKARIPRMNAMPSGISLYECHNMYEETERCAKRIKELHDTGGTEYRHMAVAVRNTADYDVIIKTIFRKYEIPFYIDDKKTLDNNPLIKTVLAVLGIISDDWQIKDVLECIKAGIFLPYESNDENIPFIMENEILKLGLRGKSRWKKASNENCICFYNAIDALYSEFAKCRSLSDACSVFCEYLLEQNIKSVIEVSAVKIREEGNDLLADEYSRIWNIFIEVIEQIALFLGDQPVESARSAASALLKTLSAGFAQYRIGFLPSDIDSVQIMSIERSRSSEIKMLFLIGANDGVLPAHFTDDGLLRDAERELLKKNGISLADDSEAKAAKENYYIYITLSLASDRLEISWPLENMSGDSMKPSPVILRKLRTLFPSINIDICSAADVNESTEYTNCENAYIETRTNAEIFNIGGVLHTNVSRIESYYKCPFSFLMSYGLKLKPRDEAGIEFFDLGNVMHGIVDKATDALLDLPQGADIRRCADIADSVYESVASEMRFAGRELTSRESHALYRIRKYAAGALYNVKKQIDAGNFRTVGYETAFDHSQASPLNAIDLIPNAKTSAIEKISVTGRIDRYDVMEEDGVNYIRVVDYKSSDVSLTEDEIRCGTKLQLMTYLNAVIDSYPKEKAMPAGALYFTFGNDISSSDEHVAPDDEKTKKNFTMHGYVLSDKRVLDGMTGGYETGVIGGKKGKDGVSFGQNKNMLKSAEDFERIRNIVYNNIINASELIVKGSFPIAPAVNIKSKKTPCKNCKMYAVCANCQKLD